MFGKSLNELFSPEIQREFPYHTVSKGYCPSCQNLIPINEQFPPGRTSRSLCQRCYYDLITNKLGGMCLICRKPLPAYKLQGQANTPREISEYIHDGECIDYFTLIHCKVVGEDMSFVSDESPAYNQLPYHKLPDLSFQDTHIKGHAADNYENIEKAENLLNSSIFHSKIRPNNLVTLSLRNKIIDTNFEGFQSHSDTGVEGDEKITVITLPKSAFNYN
jgi:hypothetical protein